MHVFIKVTVAGQAEHQDYAGDDGESVGTSTSLASISQGAPFKRQHVSLSALANAARWHGCIILMLGTISYVLVPVLVSKEITMASHRTPERSCGRVVT